VSENTKPTFLSDILDVAWEKFKKGSERPVFPFGFKDLDELTRGIPENRVTFLAGRTSDGKTSFACNVAIQSALLGKAVYYVTLEDTAVSLLQKMLCICGKFNYAKLVRGFITREEERIFEKVKESLSAIKFLFFENGVFTYNHIKEIAGMNPKPDLLVFDYIQNINTIGKDKYNTITDFARELRRYAIQEEITVLCLSQLNRGNTEKPRPELQHLSSSGALEEVAEMAILLRYPSRWNGLLLDNVTSALPQDFEVIVAKNKTGPCGEVKLRFIAEQLRFEDYVATAEEMKEKYDKRQPEGYKSSHISI